MSGKDDLALAKKTLVPIIKRIARHTDVKAKLAEGRKRREKLDRSDFVWHELLGSFATLGGSNGARGLMHDQANYRRVTFAALERKSSKAARLTELRKVLRKAGVRWPEKKAEWLAENFELVTKLGGPRKARTTLLRCDGRASMIEFWRQFKGLRSSQKCARNIMMDCYHPNFRSCIAVDARIKRITAALGFPSREATKTRKLFISKWRNAPDSKGGRWIALCTTFEIGYSMPSKTPRTLRRRVAP